MLRPTTQRATIAAFRPHTISNAARTSFVAVTATARSFSTPTKQLPRPSPSKDPKTTLSDSIHDPKKMLQEQQELKAQDQSIEAKTYVSLDGDLKADEADPQPKKHGDSGFRIPEDTLISSIPGPKALTLRGVVFDSRGVVTQLDQEFQRAQICAENTLQPRDLRKLDTSLGDQSQVILVRDKAIVVNLSHVRALIRADKVIIVAAPTSDSSETAQQQSAFIYELQGKLQAPKDSTVFEIKVMEAILSSVAYGLQQELHEYEKEASDLFVSLDESVDDEKLKELLLLRRSYIKFLQRVEGFRSAVNEVLNNDEDMAGMFLTDKANGIPRITSDHMEMELMLEHYAKLGDELVMRITETTSNLQTTQQMIGVSLDHTRNQLIVFDLRANLATASLTSAGLVAALLGMNLPNYIDAVPWIFPIVSVGSVVLARAVYTASMGRVSQIIKWKGLLGRGSD